MLATARFDPLPDNGEQADSRPSPAFWDSVGATFRQSRDDQLGHLEEEKTGAYMGLYGDLVRSGRAASRYFGEPDPGGPTVWNYDLIWRDAVAAGMVDPDRAKFDKAWQDAMRGRQAKDADTAARSGWAPWLLGSIAGGLTDPINVLTLPMGAGAGGVLRMGLTEAAINAGTEAVEQPLIAIERARQGRPGLTAEEAAANVGIAGVAGFALPVTIHATGKVGARVGGALYDKLPLDVRLARALGKESLEEVGDADIARAFAASVPEHLRLPDEADALAVVQRGAEVDAGSPFRESYEGIVANRAALDDATAALEQGRLPPQRGGLLDGRIVSFLRGKGYSEAQARGIAAGIHAESASNAAARNPSSGAFGIGQWLGPRKDELFRRYGPNPSLQQQLEFLDWELRGGDHGGAAVIAAGSEDAALDAYIRKFMRPAAGAETSGDLARGMEALGRGGEKPGTGDADFGNPAIAELDDALAAEQVDLARRADDAAGDVAALEAQRAAAPDAELDPVKVDAGTLSAVRDLVATPEVSLNRVGELAGSLGVSEGQLRNALDSLVNRGELRRTQAGSYRRLARAANAGPEELLRFVARRGGVAYDGLNEAGRKGGTLGHDLRNTGGLNRFVPGAGPLLRPNGRSLDEIGELIHDAGYLGPPEITPRPTESEVIELLDRSAGGEKIYSFRDDAPEAKADAREFEGPDEAEEAHRAALDAYWARVDHVSDIGEKRLGLMLMPKDVDAIVELMRDGIPIIGKLDAEGPLDPADVAPFVLEYINRKADEALDAAFDEIEDAYYDIAAELAGEAETPRAGGSGRSPDAGDEGAGAAGARVGQGDERPAQLNPAARDALEEAQPSTIDDADPGLAGFDVRDGEAAKAAAESDWHDIRAMEAPTETYPIYRAGTGAEGGWWTTSRAYAEQLAERDKVPLWQAEVARSHPMFRDVDEFNSPEKGITFQADLTPEEVINARLANAGIAERQRQEAALKAQAPMRAKTEQDGEMGLGLFDAADQRTFDLEDGKGPRTAKEIGDELAKDRAALDALKGCLK